MLNEMARRLLGRIRDEEGDPFADPLAAAMERRAAAGDGGGRPLRGVLHVRGNGVDLTYTLVAAGESACLMRRDGWEFALLGPFEIS